MVVVGFTRCSKNLKHPNCSSGFGIEGLGGAAGQTVC